MTTVKVVMSEIEEMPFVTKETTSSMAAEITTTMAPSLQMDILDESSKTTVTRPGVNQKDILDGSSKTTVTRPGVISIIILVVLIWDA